MNTTPNTLRGFLIPNTLITKDNLWTAQSTFNTQGAHAGIPTVNQDYTSMTLNAVGDQTNDILITTVEGGTPGEKASFVWQDVNTAVKLNKNHSNVITDWKYLYYSSNPTQYYNDFGVCADTDGTLYWVKEFVNGSIYTISVSKQKRNGGIQNLFTFFTGTLTSAPNETAKPSIVLLSDGSLIVTYFDYTSADVVNLFVWRSYDQGATWTKVSSRALINNYIDISSTGWTIETSNLVTSDNIVSLILSLKSNVTNSNYMFQFVSRDQGLSFYSVGIDGSGTSYHMVSATSLPQGAIGLAYINGTTKIAFTRIANPGILASSTEYRTLKEVTVSTGVLTVATSTVFGLTGGKLTSWYADGVLYIAAMSTGGVMYGWQSTDLGDTWQYISQPNFVITSANGYMYQPQSSTSLTYLKGVQWEGRTAIVCKTGYSMGLLCFGGWSSWQHPAIETQPARNQYARWFHNWIHNQIPSTSTYYTTTGTGTASILIEALRIVTNNTLRYYTYTGAITPIQYQKWRMRVTSGTSSLNDYIALVRTSSDASFSYTVKLRFTTTGFTILDHSTQLASVSIGLSSYYEFALFQNSTSVTVYYRLWDEKQAKVWNSTTVTLGTQPSGLPGQMYWGHPQLLLGSLTSYWSEMHVSEGNIGTVNADYRGEIYSASAEYTYIDNGLLISTQGAPARASDTYTISPTYDYPIQNAFWDVALSPRVSWRSDDDSAQRIAIYMDDVVQATDKTLGASDTIAIHLNNINWRSASLKYWNGAAWILKSTIDSSGGLVSTFSRKGASLTATGTGKPFYFTYGECAGWHAVLESGATKQMIPLKTNSEGLWSTATDAKRAIVYIDTDKINPTTLLTSGTIRFMPSSITVITSANESSTLGQYAWAIEIDAQSTFEGYFEIGSMLIGNMYIMSPQYQRGRSISYEPNVQSYETQDGMYFARKMSDGRRTFQVAWTEPVDTTQIFAKNPDYWRFNELEQPIAHYGDAVLSMMGVARHLSEQKPIVYIPALPYDEDTYATYVINRYHSHALVRLSGAISMESVLGDEDSTEMFRLATITLQEIE